MDMNGKTRKSSLTQLRTSLQNTNWRIWRITFD